MKSGILFLLFALAACTTPKVILKNDKTGQVTICGGNTMSSLTGGIIGYHIQKGNDAECVNDYSEQGFKVISHTE